MPSRSTIDKVEELEETLYPKNVNMAAKRV